MSQLTIFSEPPQKPPPVAVHVKDGCDVYCGRRFREWAYPSPKNPTPGKFGNPFREGGVRPHELMLWCVEEPNIPKEVYNLFLLSLDLPWAQELNRADPIRAFELYLLARVEVDPEWRAALLALDGLRLGCWCKPKRCHVDVIVRWIRSTLAR